MRRSIGRVAIALPFSGGLLRRPRSLINADVLLAHDGRPLLQFGLDLARENAGAAADRIDAEFLESLLDARGGKHGVRRAIHADDDRSGRAGWREQTEPSHRIAAGQAASRSAG